MLLGGEQRGEGDAEGGEEVGRPRPGGDHGHRGGEDLVADGHAHPAGGVTAVELDGGRRAEAQVGTRPPGLGGQQRQPVGGTHPPRRGLDQHVGRELHGGPTAVGLGGREPLGRHPESGRRAGQGVEVGLAAVLDASDPVQQGQARGGLEPSPPLLGGQRHLDVGGVGVGVSPDALAPVRRAAGVAGREPLDQHDLGARGCGPGRGEPHRPATHDEEVDPALRHRSRIAGPAGRHDAVQRIDAKNRCKDLLQRVFASRVDAWPRP